MALSCSSGPEAGASGLLRAATFYASFDEAVRGDFGGGAIELSTRSNHKTEKGEFVFQKGYPAHAFRIAPGKGTSGGALEAVDVLPDNGRIFFPAKGNIAYRKGGWGATLSVRTTRSRWAGTSRGPGSTWPSPTSASSTSSPSSTAR